MKNLKYKHLYIILALISIDSFACQFSIPESYVPTFLNPPVSGHYEKCDSEPCHCIDTVNPWTYALIDEVDELEIYTGNKILVESQQRKSEYESAQSAKTQLEYAMVTARKSQSCGNDTMAYMLVRNAPKGLSNSQKISLVETYSTIKALLETGSLESAKLQITAAVADGVVVTESDKTALNAYIDGCKP